MGTPNCPLIWGGQKMHKVGLSEKNYLFIVWIDFLSFFISTRTCQQMSTKFISNAPFVYTSNQRHESAAKSFTLEKLLGDWPLNNVPLNIVPLTNYLNHLPKKEDESIHCKGWSFPWIHPLVSPYFTKLDWNKRRIPLFTTPKFGRAFLRWWQDEILPGGFCVRLISRKGKDDKTIIKHGLYGLYGLYSINQNFLK